MLLMSVSQAQVRSEAIYGKRCDELIRTVIVPGGVTDPRVLESVRKTKRHEFVAPEVRPNAYFDMALPIGNQQTISSPFIVAFMTQALDPQPTDRVLEIGTGSGYQAAILSPLVKDVYSIEIVRPLGEQAKQTLTRLGYSNIHVKIGDGFQGWDEYAPYDKIVVTCSPEEVPQPLIDQLKEGGQIVIPVGERYQQDLCLLRKVDGQLERTTLRPTLFVPMTGTAEDQREVLPDLSQIRIVNGTFEQPPEGQEHLPGWFYQRQVELVKDPQAKEGNQFVRFSNEVPGRGSRLLQGFALDGNRFKRLVIEAWVKPTGVRAGPVETNLPSIAVSFYDKNRVPLGDQWLGPWRGTSDWKHVKKAFRIPSETSEGIFRIGLFGATGEFSVDGILVRGIER